MPTLRPHHLLISCLFFAHPYSVLAASKPTKIYHYSIEAGDLAGALTTLSKRFSRPILFKPEDVKGYKSQRIEGNYPLDRALTLLLHETKLAFDLHDSGIIIRQQTPEEAIQKNLPPVIAEVVVEGFRNSLASAKNLKYDATRLQDSIVAEDIAKFPDLNLAESLQRIPGIAINREGGEGRRISLRGLGPDFTLVKLNGMEVLANSDSPMDSRGQRPRDRAFDFNIFASELFSEIHVIKSYSAELQEGGFAGIVDLQTPKPFDKPGRQLALSSQLGSNTYTHESSPRIASVASNTWQHFGLLASFAYSRRNTEEQGANTVRWRRQGPNGADISQLNPEIQSRWQDQQIFVPRGNRYSVWQSQQQRLGVTTTLQYKTPSLNWHLDILHSQLENTRNEHHLYSRGQSLTPVIPGVSQVIDARLNSENELLYASYRDASMATESRYQYSRTLFNQYAFHADWQINDRLTLRTSSGIETSDLEIPDSDKVYTGGRSDLIVDYEQDRFFGHYYYAADTTDIDLWSMSEIDVEEYYAKNELLTYKAELEFNLPSLVTLNSGVSLRFLDNATAYDFADNLLRDQWQSFSQGTTNGATDSNGVVALDSRLPEANTFVFDHHRYARWLALDVEKTLAFFDVDSDQRFGQDGQSRLSINDSTDSIEEDTAAVFFTVAWEGNLFGKSTRGKIGARYSETKTAAAFEDVSGIQYLRNRYNHVLPSAHLAIELTTDIILRGAFSQNINRPQLNVLSGSPLINVDETSTPTIVGPNPKLQPFFSTNYDAAFEWYFTDGYSALSLFYKNVDDYIVTQGFNTTFTDTGLPTSLLQDGLNTEDVFQYITHTNSESAAIKGFELATQRELTFLPSPFDKMGIAANTTFVLGEVEYYDNDTGERLFSKALPHTSKNTHNFTVYYESARFGARLSSNYRGRYISLVDTNVLTDEDERGFHSTIHVDASAFYRPNEHITLTAEATNITNERDEQYSDSADRAYNTTTSGTTYYIGISYKI